MKKVIIVILMLMCSLADAKGSFSSGGGRGGFSSGGSRSSFSAPSRAAPMRAMSQPARAPMRTTTTTTVNRSTTRNYSTHVNYGGGHMYGGMGMGYGYSNGILTGMILGNMMHPYGTMMYGGPGMYGNNALLYPDGRVVNQQGYQVGTYANDQFTAQSGGMVAQAVPQDAMQPQAQPQAQPVQVIVPNDPTETVLAFTIAAIFVIILLVIIL